MQGLQGRAGGGISIRRRRIDLSGWVYIRRVNFGSTVLFRIGLLTGYHDVEGMKPLGPIVHLKFYTLTGPKGFKVVVRLDVRIVNKHVLPVLGVINESVALLGVEPFYSTVLHGMD